MREARQKRTLTLLTVLGVVMIVASGSVARQNRKESPPASSSKSSGGSRSSGSSSQRSAPTSSSGSSSRSSSRSSSSSSSATSGRSYRKTTPQQGTTSTSRSTGRASAPRQSASASSRSDVGSSSGRVSRKRSTPGTAPSSSPSTVNSGRTNRQAGSYNHYPDSRRSLYHYHRDHYPSSRIFYWVSWPNCCRPICYTWGPHYTFGSFWPYYHRRFVFVSLGGYWPGYTYRRYYWYGHHPYRWYGDYPPADVIAGDTYNYYYYNDAPQGEALNEAHRRLEEAPPAEPAEESQTDRYFEQAVKAFEAGDYAAAAQRFHEAQNLAPNDIVLPFARVQALFAAGEYHNAAAALREALAIASPDKEGVFYPRGLYSDESILSQQIEQLSRVVQLNPADSDSSLLLGYQLLGTSKLDEAAGHLESAKLDSSNNQAATLLTNLLQKLKQPAGGGSDVREQQPESPKPSEAGQSQPADDNAKAPPTRKSEDVDIRAIAMTADNWLTLE